MLVHLKNTLPKMAPASFTSRYELDVSRSCRFREKFCLTPLERATTRPNARAIRNCGCSDDKNHFLLHLKMTYFTSRFEIQRNDE